MHYAICTICYAQLPLHYALILHCGMHYRVCAICHALCIMRYWYSVCSMQFLLFSIRYSNNTHIIVNQNSVLYVSVKHKISKTSVHTRPNLWMLFQKAILPACYSKQPSPSPLNPVKTCWMYYTLSRKTGWITKQTLILLRNFLKF